MNKIYISGKLQKMETKQKVNMNNKPCQPLLVTNYQKPKLFVKIKSVQCPICF